MKKHIIQVSNIALGSFIFNEYYNLLVSNPFTSKRASILLFIGFLKNKIEVIQDYRTISNELKFMYIKYLGVLFPILLDVAIQHTHLSIEILYRINILMAMWLDYKRKAYYNVLLGFFVMITKMFKQEDTDFKTTNQFALIYTVWNSYFSYLNMKQHPKLQSSNFANIVQMTVSLIRNYYLKDVKWHEERVYGLAFTLIYDRVKIV